MHGCAFVCSRIHACVRKDCTLQLLATRKHGLSRTWRHYRASFHLFELIQQTVCKGWGPAALHPPPTTAAIDTFPTSTENPHELNPTIATCPKQVHRPPSCLQPPQPPACRPNRPQPPQPPVLNPKSHPQPPYHSKHPQHQLRLLW